MDNKLGIKMGRVYFFCFCSFEELMGWLVARLRLPSKSLKFSAQLLALGLTPIAVALQPPAASGLGLVSAHTVKPAHTHLMIGKKAGSKNYTELPPHFKGNGVSDRTATRHGKSHGKATQKTKKDKKTKAQIFYPQDYAGSLKATTIAPGVVYKHFKGPLVMNVLDIDTIHAPVKIRPILASDSFDALQNIGQHAKSTHALAAVNANYFKKNGTPLGTLILDGEWIAGPLFDRVSLGVAKSGKVRVDRVNLAGTLETSNPLAPTIWINNINQPRRTGSRLVAYTRRWGNFVRLPYEGNLLAVNASGEVIGKSLQSISIPQGGYVLSDSKDGPTAKLLVGDAVKLSWRTAPATWSDVDEAVSGGPLLIKDGNVFVDLKDEAFRAGWTSCHIKARTAAGVTNNHHLLLVTVEGPHTLWDLAKFLRGMGAVDALNLDGGGSTTMFVNGQTVTQSKRKVASAIGIFADAGHHMGQTDLVEWKGSVPVASPGSSPSPSSASNGTSSASLQKCELHPAILSTVPQLSPKLVQPDSKTLTVAGQAIAPLPGK
jgi:exopolysaccharide biosynthesis protein